MQDLNKQLPGYYSGSPEMESIQKALGGPLKALWSNYSSFLEQLLPTTATWSLPIWEEALALTPTAGESTESRRARVIAKLCGRPTTTAEQIAAVAGEAFNGKVRVDDHPRESRIEITSLETRGYPPGKAWLTAMLNEIIPAHISWVVNIRRYTWEELEEEFPTWEDLEGKTWEEIYAD